MTKTALVKLATPGNPLAIVEKYSGVPAFVRVPASPEYDVQAVSIGWQGSGFRLVELVEIEEPASPLHVRINENRHLSGNLLTITGIYAAPSIDALKNAKHAEIEAAFEAVLSGGFAFDFGGAVGVKTLDTDAVSRERWTQVLAASTAAVMAELGSIEKTWRAKDNSEFSVSYAQGMTCIAAMFSAGHDALMIRWALKNALGAATTIAQVEAIDVAGADWPS